MKYILHRMERNGYFHVIMDYNHELAVKLADTLDADPKLDCYMYEGRKGINQHVVYVRVTDTSLRKQGDSAMQNYVYDICERVLGPNELKRKS